jgi:hypothetical protein
VAGADWPAGVVPLDPPAKPIQERFQLRSTAVHVADNVERPGHVCSIVEQLFVRDGGRVDRIEAAQHVHFAETTECS